MIFCFLDVKTCFQKLPSSTTNLLMFFCKLIIMLKFTCLMLLLVCEFNNKLFLNSIHLALKESTLARKVAPVACGSGLKSTQSVIPLLEMVLNFLPSPLERKYNIPEEIHTCGMVFKVAHDKRKGQLSYIRMVIF